MAAPEHVPRPPNELVRSYRAPDHVPDGWAQDRPSDLAAEQPTGGEFGFQGPDQGYALGLARRFEGSMVLSGGEHSADAVQGAVLVAMKRASLYGRAPVIHDVEIGLRVWGFLDPADEELVAMRRRLFEGISNPHHYFEAREVVDAVPESTLRMLPAAVADRHRSDWRALLAL